MTVVIDEAHGKCTGLVDTRVPLRKQGSCCLCMPGDIASHNVSVNLETVQSHRFRSRYRIDKYRTVHRGMQRLDTQQIIYRLLQLPYSITALCTKVCLHVQYT